ncbi:transposase [Streptosporangium algeriense]|uniref:Transposase n=1 Tax=Streptosporangium algeriense TaxID=1682748 RepID=A0ABW3DIN4_9ACTN
MRDGNVDGVIFHTDRGSEHAAARFQAACRHWGVVQSTGRAGCALDNAPAESFNATLKVEFAYRHRFATRAEARLRVATWIADFYNTQRQYGATDGLPPLVYEQQTTAARAATTARYQQLIAA